MIRAEIRVPQLVSDLAHPSRSAVFGDPMMRQAIEFGKNEKGAVAVLLSHQ